jgi:hypothetical protein
MFSEKKFFKILLRNMSNWKQNARKYFKQCYDCRFDAKYEFDKGKLLCQVIGAAIYGEQADAEMDEKDETKFGYSEAKAKHILKIQNVSQVL